MISWLNGCVIEAWRNGNRSGVIIACSGVGYEVQTLNRSQDEINKSKELVLWVHQVQREDGSSLIGFLEKLDRDFFRKLISVSGVGPQLAISLLDKKQSNQLICAITQKDIPLLTSCPGIGKRIAERLVIELQNKLEELSTSNIFPQEIDNFKKTKIDPDLSSEVQSALINLGYKESEITKAFNELEIASQISISENQLQDKNSKKLDFEAIFKETLLRINTEARNKAT